MSKKQAPRFNSRHPEAVALRWLPDREPAPRLIAKGAGNLAEKMLSIARANGIPIREDRDLLQILSWLDAGEEIPTEIYTAIAEILVFIYWTSRRYEDVFGTPVSETNSMTGADEDEVRPT